MEESPEVAGIDYSTFNVDIVTLPLYGTAGMAMWFRYPLRTAKDNGDLAAFHAAKAMHFRLAAEQIWDNVRSAFIESPVPAPRNMMTAVKLSRIEGAILAALPLHVHAEECHPSEWKRILAGKADATKEEVVVAAKELGVRFAAETPQDAYDAFGMAWALKTKTLATLMAVKF